MRIAHMQMNQRSASFIGLMGGFNLLRYRDRHGGIIFLARHGTGNGSGYNHWSHECLLIAIGISSSSQAWNWYVIARLF